MKTYTQSRIFVSSVLLVMLSLVLSACGSSAPPAPVEPTQDIAMIQTQAAQTVVANLTLNAPPPPTATLPPTGPTTDPNIPVAVVPTAAAGSPSAVANSRTTIYSGPGTNYVVYGAFLNGQSALITGRSEDGQWWAISVPVAPEGTGWLSASAVTASGAGNVPVLPTPPVPPTTAMVPPEPGDPQATAIANVFVRSGPAVNFPAYGVANAGTTGRVIGLSEDGQWWVVRLNPANVGVGFGWVMGQYVQTSNTENMQVVENPETPVLVIPPAPPSGAAIATATDFINVRTGPGMNFPVLVVAPPGSTAEITGRSSDNAWWQVRVPTRVTSNGLAWVSASFVVAQNTGNVPVVNAPPAPPTVAAVPPIASAGGCSIVSQSPANNATFNANTPFTATWVLQNSGSQAWDRTNVDIRFVSALNNVVLHTGPSLFDLSTNVNPGGTYNFSQSMLAPWTAGSYGEVWELVQGSRQICQFSVYITVP
jgi:uncharacterized protein YraI